MSPLLRYAQKSPDRTQAQRAVVVAELNRVANPPRKVADELVKRTSQRLNHDPHPAHNLPICELGQARPPQAVAEVVGTAASGCAPQL
jgi:hypothetical protein